MRWLSAVVLLVLMSGAMSSGAMAGSDDPGTQDPPFSDIEPQPEASQDPTGRMRLIEVPPGCFEPDLPDLVFVGTAIDSDFRAVRFEILQVRAGDPEPWAVGGLIDVRYGLEVQYLETGTDYLVSARSDPFIGVLESRVSEPAPQFGGDDIAGRVETEAVCPGFEDPVRTLHPDGSTLETSVLGPLFESRSRLLGSLVFPFAVAFGLVFVLAMLRLGVAGVVRGLRNAATPRRQPL